MSSTILHIKNMVCNRCIKVVKEELVNLGYTIRGIELGEVTLNEKFSKVNINQISQVLLDNGFELIDDRKSKIISRIKT